MNDERETQSHGETPGLNELNFDEIARDDAAHSSDAIVHALLASWFDSKEKREARIQRTLELFDQEQQAVIYEQTGADGSVDSDVRTETVSPTNESKLNHSSATELIRYSRLRRIATFILSTSAMLLLLFSLWYSIQPSELQASMNRVIEATTSVETRIYNVEIRRPMMRRSGIGSCTLYSQSDDRFVAIFDNPRLQPAVIGGNENQRWVVRGDRHFVSDSTPNIPQEFFVDKLTMKHMQINSLLTELPDAYELKLLDEEPLPGGLGIDCRPIRAVRKVRDASQPAQIKIWPHPRTGVVHRMTIWQVRPTARRLPATVIDLKLTSVERLPDEFFSWEYHLPAKVE